MYNSYLNRICRMAIIYKRLSSLVEWTSCAVVYTVSHGLSRSCTIANTIIHGHDTRVRFLKVLKSYTAFTGSLEWPECNSDKATVDSVVCTVQISFTYHLECTGTLPLTKREWRGTAPLPPRFYRSYRSIPWNDN